MHDVAKMPVYNYLAFADKQVTGNDSLNVNVVPLVLTANSDNTVEPRKSGHP